MNPVDAKVRVRAQPEAGSWKVLGWDAAGVIELVGPDASLFKPGDEVFYAGALGRSGTNAEFHLVDERIVGRKPRSLSWSEAAAMPLTAITAWEALFDRLDVRKPVAGVTHAILIVGGAGGVGSIATQLARQLTNLTVVTTASRPETIAWSQSLGAHHVVDHTKPLAGGSRIARDRGARLRVLDHEHGPSTWPRFLELIAPQGRFALIDDPKTLDVSALKPKSVSLHWEFMFTRSMFGTSDIAEQGKLLDEVARLVDFRHVADDIRPELRRDQCRQPQARPRLDRERASQGKIVLEGFER